MKRIIIILIAVFLAGDIFSQTYFKFPTSDAIWNYKIVGSSSYPYEWPVIVSLGQQTTIGSYQYFEVYNTSLGSSSLLGAIREDTIQKKVYFHDFTDEIVLYDFTLEIGDTIYYSTNLYYNLDYFKVVDNIDSTLVSGQYRKTWFLTNSFLGMTDIWIEGIGSVYRYGLLYPIDPDVVLDNSDPYFGCFSHDIITYIDGSNCDGDCPCSYWLVNINVKQRLPADLIKIYPIPFIMQFSIDLSELHFFGKIDIKLVNNLGIEIESFTINSEGQNQFKLSPTQKLKSGIYFLQFRINDENYCKKVLVAN